MSEHIRVGDLTRDHEDMVVLDVPGIAGWQDHLVLSCVEGGREGGTVYLAFRWNDDPSPSNTRRGKFAVGKYLDPDLMVRVTQLTPRRVIRPANQ